MQNLVHHIVVMLSYSTWLLSCAIYLLSFFHIQALIKKVESVKPHNKEKSFFINQIHRPYQTKISEHKTRATNTQAQPPFRPSPESQTTSLKWPKEQWLRSQLATGVALVQQLCRQLPASFPPLSSWNLLHYHCWQFRLHSSRQVINKSIHFCVYSGTSQLFWQSMANQQKFWELHQKYKKGFLTAFWSNN